MAKVVVSAVHTSVQEDIGDRSDGWRSRRLTPQVSSLTKISVWQRLRQSVAVRQQAGETVIPVRVCRCRLSRPVRFRQGHENPCQDGIRSVESVIPVRIDVHLARQATGQFAEVVVGPIDTGIQINTDDLTRRWRTRALAADIRKFRQIFCGLCFRQCILTGQQICEEIVSIVIGRRRHLGSVRGCQCHSDAAEGDIPSVVETIGILISINRSGEAAGQFTEVIVRTVHARTEGNIRDHTRCDCP